MHCASLQHSRRQEALQRKGKINLGLWDGRGVLFYRWCSEKVSLAGCLGAQIEEREWVGRAQWGRRAPA